jgi:hypothetical protein
MTNVSIQGATTEVIYTNNSVDVTLQGTSTEIIYGLEKSGINVSIQGISVEVLYCLSPPTGKRRPVYIGTTQ